MNFLFPFFNYSREVLSIQSPPLDTLPLNSNELSTIRETFEERILELEKEMQASLETNLSAELIQLNEQKSLIANTLSHIQRKITLSRKYLDEKKEISTQAIIYKRTELIIKIYTLLNSTIPNSEKQKTLDEYEEEICHYIDKEIEIITYLEEFNVKLDANLSSIKDNLTNLENQIKELPEKYRSKKQFEKIQQTILIFKSIIEHFQDPQKAISSISAQTGIETLKSKTELLSNENMNSIEKFKRKWELKFNQKINPLREQVNEKLIELLNLSPNYNWKSKNEEELIKLIDEKEKLFAVSFEAEQTSFCRITDPLQDLGMDFQRLKKLLRAQKRIKLLKLSLECCRLRELLRLDHENYQKKRTLLKNKIEQDNLILVAYHKAIQYLTSKVTPAEISDSYHLNRTCQLGSTNYEQLPPLGLQAELSEKT